MSPLLVPAIACAILELLPKLPPARATSRAEAIARVSSTVDEAAALAVTFARESSGDWGVESCSVAGMGGAMGAYQLSNDYAAFACGSFELQSTGALKALRDKGFGTSPLKAFRGYTGAVLHGSEARVRLALWTVARAQIDCACSF